MAEITMQFNVTEIPSLQIGDIAYYSTPEELGGFQNSNSMQEIGTITSVTQVGSLLTIMCNINENTIPPTETDFIFFAKDNRVNMASLLGYYGLAKFSNNSITKAEMFSVSCEIDQSSK